MKEKQASRMSKIILLGEMEKVSIYICISTNQAKSEEPKSMNDGNCWGNKVKQL